MYITLYIISEREKPVTALKKMLKSTRYLNGLGVRLLHLHFWDSHSEHPIFYGSLYLIHLGIFWQPKATLELAAAPLNTMPFVVLLLLFFVLLPTDLQDSAILNFDFDFDFFLFQPGKVSLKNVSFRVLLPANACVDKRRGLAC